MACNNVQRKGSKGCKAAKSTSRSKSCPTPTLAETQRVLMKVKNEMMNNTKFHLINVPPEPFLRSPCIGGCILNRFDMTVPYNVEGHASVICLNNHKFVQAGEEGIDMALKFWSSERVREAPDQPEKELAAAKVVKACPHRTEFVTVRKIYNEPHGTIFVYENAGWSLDQIRASPWYMNKLTKREKLVFSLFVFVAGCKQLVVLQQLGLYHRDIKLGNVMMDLHTFPRLADFGLAVKSDLGDDFTIGFDLRCLDPEQLKATDRWGVGAATRWGNEALAKAATSNVTDIFQLASMFWEMLFGKPSQIDVTNPKRFKLNGTTMARMPYYHAVLAFNYREDSQMLLRIPKAYRKVLGCCLSGDASQRPTAEQLLAMPCFKQQCQLYEDLAARAAPAVEAKRAAIDAWVVAIPEPPASTASQPEDELPALSEASAPLTPQLSMMLRRCSSVISRRRDSKLSSDGTHSCRTPGGSSGGRVELVAEMEDTAVSCFGGLGNSIKGRVKRILSKMRLLPKAKKD